MSIITNQDILDAIRGLYENTPNKVSDAAAQNELALIKAELIAGLSVSNWPTLQQVKAADTDTALATILGKLEDIESELAAIKTTDGIKKIADTVGITASDNAITALGALAAAAVTDPSQSASVIALLKGMLKQLQGTGTGAAPVQLTGSNVEKNTVFARSIRTSSVTSTITRPSGAKGFIAVAKVYGVTGTFASGEGLSLRIQIQGAGGGTYGDIQTDKKAVSNRAHGIQVYPGVVNDDLPDFTGSSKKLASMFCPAQIILSLSINGTYAGGEGIDCECEIEWIYG